MIVSVILPTYNERGNIVKLIQEIIKHIEKTHYVYEIVVVDDNSPDKTGFLCTQLFSKNSKIKVFIRKNKREFASAIYYGIKKSKGAIIIVMDTDFSHNPKLISVMLKMIKHYDIVIASRYAKNGGGENKKRYWMSKIYNSYLRYILKINISDFLFGYFCIRRDFLIKNDLLQRDIFTGFGDYFIRLAYHINKSGGTFLEIPAFYKSRIYGASKSDLKKMIYTYTKTSLKLLVHDIFIKKN
ncbi:MAG: glycosyltransferase [Candidatus Levybacteria bacterium]|nr:glycosyltransferase [Candidatus Levybacteria bacterium]